MAQPYKIINLRKRLKANGYKEIIIKQLPDHSPDGEDYYKIMATTPLSGYREIKILTPSEAETILRRHKPVNT